MTPRERVEAALLGKPIDMVPFTCWEVQTVRGHTERQLRNDGLCMVVRSPGVYTTETPNVRSETCNSPGPSGVTRIRHAYHTPVGNLSASYDYMTIATSLGHCTRPQDWLFKTADDYEAIEFLIRDRVYSPNYDAVRERAALMGDDAIMMAAMPYTPLQDLIVSVMGIERFSIEWADRRDRVMRLYDALTDDRRKLYPVVAEAPVMIVNYCGNVSPEVVGVRRFEEFYMPHYEEAGEVLHAHGKLMGIHQDAKTRIFAEALARSPFDYIESFNPAPMGDMTMAEARAAWPDKIIWINFPSSVHLEPVPEVEAVTRQILHQVAPGDRFLFGVIEDVPIDRWDTNMPAIQRVILEDGRIPIRV